MKKSFVLNGDGSRIGRSDIIFHAIDRLQYAKLNKPQQ